MISRHPNPNLGTFWLHSCMPWICKTTKDAQNLHLCTSSAVSSSYPGFRVFSTLLLYNFHKGFILARMDSQHSTPATSSFPLRSTFLQVSGPTFRLVSLGAALSCFPAWSSQQHRNLLSTVSLFPYQGSVHPHGVPAQVRWGSWAVCIHVGVHTLTHTLNSASRFRLPALVTWKQV